MSTRPAKLQGKPHESALSSRREAWWFRGFAIFQGAASVADSFAILFAAAILGTAVFASWIDASGNLGYTLGAASVVLLVRRFTQYRLLVVAFLAAMALPLLFLVTAQNLALYLGLYVAFELFWASAASLAPVVAIQDRPRSQWAGAFARLNEVGALGILAGLILAGLWMAVSQWVGLADEGARSLFALLGVLTLLSALMAHYGLSLPKPARAHPWEASPAQGTRVERATERQRLLSDQLLWYYLLSFLLALGMGIAYSGVHLYMVSHMQLPIAGALAALFVFRLAVYGTSRTLSRGIGPAMATQLQSLAALARALLAALLGVFALLLPSTLAFPVTVALVALWGALTAILSVTGLLIATTLATPQRRAEAIALYTAITNGATILGALLAGALGPGLGYGPMFLIAGGVSAVAALLLLRL